MTAALLFGDDVDPDLVARVTLDGYGNLEENGIEQMGRDPFLIGMPPVRAALR